MIKKGVGAASGEMKFKTDSVHGGSKIVYSGRYDYKIDVTTIDEEIKQHVSMIKMDIEGLELDALKGCKRILSEDAPRLAICVYHIFFLFTQSFLLLHIKPFLLPPNYDVLNKIYIAAVFFLKISIFQ